MPELPADFDLKLMPDWLKEPATKNPYADYDGRDDDRRSRGRDDFGGRGRDDRRGKPGGGQRPGQGRPEDRGGRRDGPGGRKPDGKRPGGRPEDRRGDQRRPESARGQESREQQHAPPVQPAEVTIEFFPDESCAASIARQVKSTHRAYSLFDLARMFLARPERHRLKITTRSVAAPLYQVGEDGPVSVDRAAAERAAFPVSREKYYVEVKERRDVPKGNFSNVARCRSNGVLLGPTNYHGYQPALRKLYEERFSRRMPFAEFQRDIEVVSDAALVEQWKEQASSLTVYRLKPPEKPPEIPKEPEAEKKEEPAAPEEMKPAEAAAGEVPAEVVADPPAASAEAPAASAEAPAASAEAPAAPAEAPAASAEAPAAPAEAPAAYEGPEFASLAEVEQHFRQNYLPGLIRTASSFHVSGTASRSIPDRGIATAVRQAWEQERGFPGQMMHQLRQHFSRAGLHVFKHRKRMQFVSLIRPSPMEGGSLSSSVAEILQVIQGSHNCNRSSLAAAILGADESAMDPARKTTLATDLRWLIETGRVIEFSDGRLDLPSAPVKNEPAAKAKPEPAPEAEPGAGPVMVAAAAGGDETVGEGGLPDAGAEGTGEGASSSPAAAMPEGAETMPAEPPAFEDAPEAPAGATSAESPAAES